MFFDHNRLHSFLGHVSFYDFIQQLLVLYKKWLNYRDVTKLVTMMGRNEMEEISMRHTPTNTLLLALTSMLLLSACQTMKPIATVENGGDIAPLVTSSEIRSGDFSNLESGESVAMALGSDNAIARPNTVSITVYETVKSVEDKAGKIRDCDFDNDGIDDIFCSANYGKNADREKKKHFALSSYKYVYSDNNGMWMDRTWIKADDIKGHSKEIKFRLILVNSGNKPFSGTVKVADRLHQSLRFKSLDKTSLVVDQRDLKNGLSAIPIVQLFALAMDNFSIISDAPGSKTLTNELVTFESGAVSLQPQQGVMFEFSTEYTLPFGKFWSEQQSEKEGIEYEEKVQFTAEDIRPHSTGPIVKDIQQLLNDKGYIAGTADGVMGKMTRSAIEKYQADNGLEVDGIANHVLLMKLQE